MSRPNPTSVVPPSRIPVPAARITTPTPIAPQPYTGPFRVNNSAAGNVGGHPHTAPATPTAFLATGGPGVGRRTSNIINPSPVPASQLGFNKAGHRTIWQQVAIYEAALIEDFRVDQFLAQAYITIPTLGGKPAAHFLPPLMKQYEMNGPLFTDLVEGWRLFQAGHKGIANIGRVWDSHFQGEIALIGQWVTHWLTVGRDKWRTQLQDFVNQHEKVGFRPGASDSTDSVARVLGRGLVSKHTSHLPGPYPLPPTSAFGKRLESSSDETNPSSSTPSAAQPSAIPTQHTVPSIASSAGLPGCTESSHSVISIANTKCCHHIFHCIFCKLVIAAGEDGKPTAAGFLTADRKFVDVVVFDRSENAEKDPMQTTTQQDTDEGSDEVSGEPMLVDQAEEELVAGKGKGRNPMDGPGFAAPPPALSTPDPVSATHSIGSSLNTSPAKQPDSGLAQLANGLFSVGSYSSVFAPEDSVDRLDIPEGGVGEDSAAVVRGRELSREKEPMTTSSVISFGATPTPDHGRNNNQPGSDVQVVEPEDVAQESNVASVPPRIPAATSVAPLPSLPSATDGEDVMIPPRSSDATSDIFDVSAPPAAESSVPLSRSSTRNAFGTAIVYSSAAQPPVIVIDKAPVSNSPSLATASFGANIFGTMPTLALGMTSSHATTDIAALARGTTTKLNSGPKVGDEGASPAEIPTQPVSSPTTASLPTATLASRAAYLEIKPLPVTPTTPQIPALPTFAAISVSNFGQGKLGQPDGQNGNSNQTVRYRTVARSNSVDPVVESTSSIMSQTTTLESLVSNVHLSQLYSNLYGSEQDDVHERQADIDRRTDILALANLFERAFSSEESLKYHIRAVQLHIQGQVRSQGYIPFKWVDIDKSATAVREELEAEHSYRKGRGLTLPFSAWEEAVLLTHSEIDAKHLPKTKAERVHAARLKTDADTAPGPEPKTTPGNPAKRRRSNSSLAEGSGRGEPLAKAARTNNATSHPRRSADGQMRASFVGDLYSGRQTRQSGKSDNGDGGAGPGPSAGTSGAMANTLKNLVKMKGKRGGKRGGE